MMAVMNSNSWQISIFILPILSPSRYWMIGHVGDDVLNSFVWLWIFRKLLHPSKLTRYCIVLVKKPNVLKSTNITDNERNLSKEYDTVLRKFDNFFQLRRNVIFERARFNRQCQLSSMYKRPLGMQKIC